MKLIVNVETKTPLGLTQDWRQIDWLNSSDRKWLESHTTWAMHNGLSVQYTPESN